MGVGMGEGGEPTDADYEVVKDPKPHLRDPEWLALPWWKRYELFMKPGWIGRALTLGLVSAVLAALAIAGRH